MQNIPFQYFHHWNCCRFHIGSRIGLLNTPGPGEAAETGQPH
jgi:hypothetical protein